VGVGVGEGVGEGDTVGDGMGEGAFEGSPEGAAVICVSSPGPDSPELQATGIVIAAIITIINNKYFFIYN